MPNWVISGRTDRSCISVQRITDHGEQNDGSGDVRSPDGVGNTVLHLGRKHLATCAEFCAVGGQCPERKPQVVLRLERLDRTDSRQHLKGVDPVCWGTPASWMILLIVAGSVGAELLRTKYCAAVRPSSRNSPVSVARESRRESA